MTQPVKPWPVVVVWMCGVILLAGAVVSLVMTVRKTGLDQWYWAFQTVTSLVVVSMLATVFSSRK